MHPRMVRSEMSAHQRPSSQSCSQMVASLPREADGPPDMSPVPAPRQEFGRGVPLPQLDHLRRHTCPPGQENLPTPPPRCPELPPERHGGQQQAASTTEVCPIRRTHEGWRRPNPVQREPARRSRTRSLSDSRPRDNGGESTLASDLVKRGHSDDRTPSESPTNATTKAPRRADGPSATEDGGTR